VSQQHILQIDALGFDMGGYPVQIAARVDHRAAAGRATPQHRAILLKGRDGHDDTFEFGKHG
jgi:hypothetical protein